MFTATTGFAGSLDSPSRPARRCCTRSATLAVSGSSVSGNASQTQYDECDKNQDGVISPEEDADSDAPGCQMDDGGVLPEEPRSKPTCDENGDGVISPSEAAANGCGGVKGETDEDVASEPTVETSREEGAQPTRQVEASGGDELPFTGFAAVPILLGGIALLAAGLVMRKRAV